jgi:hypothetical protein
MDATTPTGSRRMNEVWPSMYSFAALPSRRRAAPAKNRRLSTMTGISSMAAATGLPAFFDSRRPISSARASMASASLRSARLRSWGVVLPQVSKAASAAFAARSTSSAPEAWTLAMTVPSAGFSTSSVSPDAESTHSPLMNCWYVFTRSATSVISGASSGLGDGFVGKSGHRSPAPEVRPATWSHVAATP